MFTKKSLATIVFALFVLVSVVAETGAQTATTFVTGLRSPIKIIYAERYGSFLVAEAGSPMTTNTGRISVVNNDGTTFPLIDGLPSAPSPPNNEQSGPSGLWLDGNSLYISFGVGNSTLRGPLQGSEIPNPNPASPLFSSVLRLDLPNFPTLNNLSYQIQPADHTRLANSERLTLGTGQHHATLLLVANFPDFTPEPRPDVPNNVRPSNPFGLVLSANILYVADAAQNQIRTVNTVNGQTGIFFTYPPRPNPGPGRPFIDPVPVSVRLFGNRLLVTFLTGAPFRHGFADVRQIDLGSGAESQVIGGLTSAIDVLLVGSGFCHIFYTLEFSTNLPMGAPGRIQRFDSPTAQPTTIINTLISPTSLALDTLSGDLLVTEIFPGRITRISIPAATNVE